MTNAPWGGHDQADGARHATGSRPVRVIAVTSGKGGVGKTNVSLNLSVALARTGDRVVLMDADLGLGNVDVLLGLQSRGNLSHVLEGTASLDEIMLEGPEGIGILPASSGVAHMAALTPAENAGLISAFSEMRWPVDTLIVDSAAGIADSVVRFAEAANEVVVVVCDEPASITDAYAVIKVLSREHDVTRFHVVANMVRDAAEGRRLFEKLSVAAKRFLDVTLTHMGSVPFDDYLRRAVQRQKTVVQLYGGAKSARAFTSMADRVNHWPAPRGPQGQLQFFVERLVNNVELDPENLL
ncbi:MinD/ParA family protein [Guyparkeria hydrothermalis]|uniref:MinD/ParA family protein n=1 Tax=Guyparkeria hydrothermalis TaxID=923 RepID=UPI00202003CB|nr:MinD/ParA family protein [Guyparkeria hydrothermalis]MCL7745418.1 MinD/ParA family protein [Guyparkeria hydrothermalis]